MLRKRLRQDHLSTFVDDYKTVVSHCDILDLVLELLDRVRIDNLRLSEQVQLKQLHL
jgi:hypothetical protein